MNQSTIIYYRNFGIFLLIGSVLSLIPVFILLDNMFSPFVEGFTFIVDNLENIIDPEIKRIVSDSNIAESTDEQQVMESLKKAYGEGEVLANNLMSFFIVYALGAFSVIVFPIYLGVKISMKLSNKWFPIDMIRIKAQHNLREVIGIESN